MEMEKPDSAAGSGGSSVLNTVFIDTSLDTHLAMIVSDSDTVSDLKKKILYEHPLCFPKIGEIKINALKVKRRGYLYHLSDSMFVKSAFDGMSKSWFLSVDASSAEEHRENHNSRKPDAGNVVACFGITNNNSSADVVDLLPGGTSKRLSNINDASLPEDGNKCHAKQNSASQQFGFSNSTKENSEDLHMEVEHTADSNSKVLFPANNKESRPKVQEKDVGDNKICEDLPASVAASVLKEKHKIKKRSKDVIHDHDVRKNGALVVESGKDALSSDNVLQENSFQNGRSAVWNDKNLADESCRSLSSARNMRSATRKRMVDDGTKVSGEHSECETNKHKDVSVSEQEYKLTENSSLSGPASKKKHKAEKKDGNENSLIKNGVSISDFVKQGTGPDTTTSDLGQKLESTSAILDHLNTESVKENRLLAANDSGGKKKRKKRKSNVTQAGSEISSAKDVNVGTFQAIEAINHKDVGSEVDPEFVLEKFSTGGAISEPCLISSMEMQEGSKACRVPRSGVGGDDMDDTDDGNMESIQSKNEAPEPDVASVIKTRDSIDQNASHVDGHPTILPQEGISHHNDNGVSGYENQSGTLEDKIMEPKKSAKKIKKSKKTKDPVGGKEAVDVLHDKCPTSDISPAEHPASVGCDHLSDNAEQDGTTDVRSDDIIGDVLESLQQCNNGPANAENMVKKSRKKTKKKSSNVVVPPELQGKDDVDHWDPTVPADNMSEVSASSKSTSRIAKVNSSSAVHLKGSDLGSKNNTGVGISPDHTQLDSSQNTLKSNHEGRPIQNVVNVDHPKSAIEVPCESERIESQHQHAIVDSGEILIDKVTNKRGVETEVKEKKKKKKKPDVQSCGSRLDLPSSQMLNGNQCKEAKAPAAKSSSVQSQRLSSKVEPHSSNVQSSKTLLTISASAAKEPLQSNKSDKINSIPKEAQRPIHINSSRAHILVEKNNAHAVSSSSLERSKDTINLNKGGNEHRSHLEIAKAAGSNNGKVMNSLANKKSLLPIAGTIFKHSSDKDSSDDEDGAGNSDASTRTPSNSSSTDDSDDSEMNISSSRNAGMDDSSSVYVKFCYRIL
ncbi:uncharacterized protein LOC111287063 isoform X2 [Durio zibethinus]|uniref:Uncharacterized protein LOC111287063 isoform X2 n=1 Tax=Durio zibethinus TaxID=66656 RepID=A0A6P5XXV1_DURZI|nr:uncharacterized protein LOC111287063 isoform X2 [Durio zibethinus]